MACCLLCFSGDPVEGEPVYQGDWQVPINKACCHAPCSCCFGFLCAECAAFSARKRALESVGQWPQGYKCCQGHIGPCPCFHPGESVCGCSEPDNACCCLCIESFCCTGLSMSSTYGYVMATYNLKHDPWYNRFVRCNNCIQLLSCICSCLAICFEELEHAAHILRLIADCVFRSLMGCINAQLGAELDFREKVGGGAAYGQVAPQGSPPFTPQQQPGYSQPQTGYAQPPPQGYPVQGVPVGGPPQGYPPQGYPPQGYPPQGYPPQGYPPQGYPGQKTME
eukprot:TRINITY_DN1369_c0_g1_i1.p1 TRINITY_DN1369_c0_g1~~TRINITY_DN1369_c0_g1_i1.p1  ORF type:complete len:308 (+),score=84.54 TRINITY_DN1369_c0_g1_i1:86-925(+)